MKKSGLKNTFLLYKDRKPLVDACSQEQAGAIFKGIYEYVCGGGIPEFDDPLIAGIFEMFRQSIDENDEAWNRKSEKAAEAIRKRWESQQAEAQKEPEKPEADHTGEVTEKAVQDRTEPDKPKEKPDPLPPKVSARTIFNACLMAYPISNDLQAAMETWLKYKTERRESYKEQGLRALMKKASQSEQEYGTSAVVDVIEESMANRYQGITWDRLRGRASPAKNTPVKKNQFTQMEQQQDYDFEGIEKDLLNST